MINVKCRGSHNQAKGTEEKRTDLSLVVDWEQNRRLGQSGGTKPMFPAPKHVGGATLGGANRGGYRGEKRKTSAINKRRLFELQW